MIWKLEIALCIAQLLDLLNLVSKRVAPEICFDFLESVEGTRWRKKVLAIRIHSLYSAETNTLETDLHYKCL